MPPIWPMTVGMAVETTDASSDTRNVATNRASVTRRRSDTTTRYPAGRPASRIAGTTRGSGGSGGGGAGGGLGRQPDAAVLHLEQHAARLGLESDPQLGAVGRILDRVLEQIGQDLFDALRIGRHVRGLPADVEQ